MYFQDSSILVTGGTGSFGKKFIEIMLKEHKPRRLIVFSRDELKQYEMAQGGFDHPSLRYFIGDVRDVGRLRRAFIDVDYVVHAAALKQVPACEYNPIEALETNVTGARNIIDAALDTGVRKVIALSTDKAVAPVNLYGATKLVAEKVFTAGNAYRHSGGCTFSSVRYGNVMGSRGSVIPLFMKQKESGRITITHPEMTRFWITLEQGVNFVIRCLEQCEGGEVFVPKIPSMKVTDLAKAIAPDAKIDIVGVRPGEKLHEQMVSPEEAKNTVDLSELYLVKPEHPWWRAGDWAHGKPVEEGFSYASNTNDNWLSVEQMREILKNKPF